MPSELAENAGSGTSLKLGGTTYHVSPLDPCDLGEVEHWLQDEPFERMRRKLEKLGDQATDTIRSQLLATAEEEAQRMRFEADEANRILTSIPGTAMMLWISLRKSKPELTYDDVVPLLTLQNLQAVQDKLDQVSGLGKEGKSPVRPRRQTKKIKGRSKRKK